MKEKKYKISVSETTGGYATVYANSEKEALQKATRIMDEEGVSGFKKFDSSVRETYVFEAEKIG